MKISVVILNWNRPQDTIAAVDSVLKQNYADFDVLVWDNASSDDSLQVLKNKFDRDPRAHIHASPRNEGVAGGRNRAFRLTTGEIIFSLDSDAIIEQPDALEKIAQHFRHDSKIGALSFEVKRSDGHLMWPFSRPASAWRYRSFETIRVDGCAFATPRSVFEKIGGFAEHFSPYGVEDRYFAHQVIGHGYKVIYFPDVVVTHAFTPKGRQPAQFMMHVRNSLLVPLELFPMPQGLASYIKSALGLFREALEQQRVPSFFKGFMKSLSDFQRSKRVPMQSEGWKHFRDLIRNEKQLGA